MRFSVGYQLFKNYDFIEDIIRYKNNISEVYLSWGDFPSGRNIQVSRYDMTPWEAQAKQISDLDMIGKENIPLNLLFNAMCYGKDSLSRAFFNKIGDTIDYMGQKYNLKSVTTTSPVIAKFIKDNFSDLDIRASVNMEIGTIEALEYLSDTFDSFYMKRELNRDFDAIEKLTSYCEKNNKKLYMLANSGCLNNCPMHTFHDNLVSHEDEISKMDNAFNFNGLCKKLLEKEENYSYLIYNTNFIRPEDIHKYEGYFESVKLATRVSKTPSLILRSYVNGSFSGNILDILEPSHSIYPYVLENGEPMKIKKLDVGGILC